MKNLKKVLALLLALSMVLCLSACGSFEKKMARSAAKMSQLDSMHMDMEMTLGMGLSVMGQSMDMDLAIKAGVDMNTEPMIVKADVEVEAMGMSEQVKLYVLDEAGKRVIYLSDDGGVSWEREVDDDADTGNAGVNIKDSIGMLAKWAKSFEKTGEETVNGSAATKYSGRIDAASLLEMMELSGADEALESSLGIDLDDDAIVLKDVPVSIWIDNKSGMVVRMEMDMTELMQSLVADYIDEVISGSLAGSGLEGMSMEMKLNTAVVEVELSQFDEVGTIELPAGVK